MLTILDSLLTEKCINTMVGIYRNSVEEGDMYMENVAKTNLKLDFVQFLLNNDNNKVREYGIFYIKDKYMDEYSILFNIICEYTNYGVSRYLSDEQYKQIKQESIDPPTEQKWHVLHKMMDYIKNIFGVEEDNEQRTREDLTTPAEGDIR